MKFPTSFLFDDEPFNGENIEEILDETIDTWRWGSVNRKIFKYKDKFYLWKYRWQPEEGIQIDDTEVECPEVEAFEKVIVDYRVVKE